MLDFLQRVVQKNSTRRSVHVHVAVVRGTLFVHGVADSGAVSQALASLCVARGFLATHSSEVNHVVGHDGQHLADLVTRLKCMKMASGWSSGRGWSHIATCARQPPRGQRGAGCGVQFRRSSSSCVSPIAARLDAYAPAPIVHARGLGPRRTLRVRWQAASLPVPDRLRGRGWLRWTR
jgi:stage V sporulation protein SpoVS